MGIEHVSENISRIRNSRGFTMQELADKCGISRVAYSNIENGKSKPKSATLIQLSKALSIDIRDLIADPPRFSSLRFRSSRALSNREKNIRQQIIYNVSRWLEDYAGLEALLKIRSPKLPDITARNAIDAAKKLRKCLRLKEDEPIIDILGLLDKRLGIKFYLVQSKLKKFFGFSVGSDDKGPAIIVNVDESISVERRIFTVAHELGHLLLHKSSFNHGDLEENKREEEEADSFAGHLLLPDAGFNREFEESKGLHPVDAILHIKRKFRVSYQVVLHRLIELGRNAQELYKAFNIAIKQRYHISLKGHVEPYSLSEDKEPAALLSNDFVEDKLHKIVREAYEKGKISLSRAAEILGLSLSQMRDLNNSWMALG